MEQTAKNVTTAGAAVPISATDLQVRSAVIQAKIANTGLIYVGSNAVDNSGDTGTALAAGETYVLAQGGSNDLYNLKATYIDADQDGEGVTVTFYRK